MPTESNLLILLILWNGPENYLNLALASDALRSKPNELYVFCRNAKDLYTLYVVYSIVEFDNGDKLWRLE